MELKERVIQIVAKENKPLTCTELLERLELENTERDKVMAVLNEMSEEHAVSLIDIEEKDSQSHLYKISYEECDGTHASAVANSYAAYTIPELFKIQSDLIFKLNALKKDKVSLSNDPHKAEKIKKIHRYNDIKDACQLVLGKLSEAENKTLGELHEEFSLNMVDK